MDRKAVISVRVKVFTAANTVTVSFFTSVVILAILKVFKLVDFEHMTFGGSEIPHVSQIHGLIMSREGK